MRADDAPLVFTGIALAVAVGLDLATHNGLWFWYTFTGLSLFVFMLGLARTHQWRIPRPAAWGVGVTAALHYVGGSLSGLHQIGGPNGLYYAFPWWDNVVHFLGSVAVAIAVFAYAWERRIGGRAITATFAIAVTSLIGILVELYEFSQFVFLHTVDQGYYTNTMIDLYNDVLGGVAGAVGYAWWGVQTPKKSVEGSTSDPAADAYEEAGLT